ncbi:MAG: DUF4339 domain-containing protein [Bdellovibrionales bacterium]|nr:DUF4339 domain-containing protein [Bdellovibrionales bacterium]
MDPTLEPTFARPAPSSPVSLDETRWFAFADEVSIGPFSTGEIQAKLIDESLSREDYVWREGMSDWEPIADVALFTPTAVVPTETPIRPGPPDLPPEPPAILRDSPLVREPVIVREPDSRVDLRAANSRRAILAIAALAAIAIGAYLEDRRAPKLPSISDISVADGRALAAAVAAAPEGGRPAAAVALAIGNPGTPIFYVATNVPDGTRLSLRVDGIAETLLAHSPMGFSQTLNVQKHLARSAPVLRRSGRGLVAGTYHVAIRAEDGRVLVERNFFLGGVADEGYRRALAAKRLSLPKQRAGELVELRQIAASLEDLLVRTTEAYGAPPGTWTKFSANWRRFADQLATEVRATPTDDEDVVHLELFSRARGTLAELRKIHENQTTVRNHHAMREKLDLAIAESTSLAQSGILALKNEIALAEKKASSGK